MSFSYGPTDIIDITSKSDPIVTNDDPQTESRPVLNSTNSQSKGRSLFSIPSLMRFNLNKKENSGMSFKKVLFILITLILVIVISVLVFVEIPENIKMILFIVSSILGLCSFAILLDKKIQ